MHPRQCSIFAAVTLVLAGCASRHVTQDTFDDKISALTREYVAGRFSLRRFVQLREMVEAERSLAQGSLPRTSTSESASASCDTTSRAEEEAREKAGEEAWKKEMQKRQAIGKELEKLYPSQPVPRR